MRMCEFKHVEKIARKLGKTSNSGQYVLRRLGMAIKRRKSVDDA